MKTNSFSLVRNNIRTLRFERDGCYIVACVNNARFKLCVWLDEYERYPQLPKILLCASMCLPLEAGSFVPRLDATTHRIFLITQH